MQLFSPFYLQQPNCCCAPTGGGSPQVFLLACVPPLKRSVHIVEGLVQHHQHVLLPVEVVEDVPLEVLLAVLCAQAATMAIEHSEVEQVRSQLYHSVSGGKTSAIIFGQ